MTVVAYMVKDRIKVWGKRYFQCIADWTGVFLPEYNSWLCTSEGVKVSLPRGACMLRVIDIRYQSPLYMRVLTFWLPQHSLRQWSEVKSTSYLLVSRLKACGRRELSHWPMVIVAWT